MRRKLDGMRKIVCHKTRYLIYRCISNKLECLLNFKVGSSALPSMLAKYNNWVYILRKNHLTEAHPVIQGSVSFQSNSYWNPSSSATLTAHGSCKEGSRAIKCWANVRRILCRVEDFSMAPLRKSIHRTSLGRRLARPSIPSLNEWKEVSNTRSYRHLL